MALVIPSGGVGLWGLDQDLTLTLSLESSERTS